MSGYNGCNETDYQEIGIKHVVGFNFIVHDPNGIILFAKDISLSYN